MAKRILLEFVVNVCASIICYLEHLEGIASAAIATRAHDKGSSYAIQ